MNLEIIETGPLQREVQIAVPADQVDKETQNALEHLQGRVKMKGFRPGKVPRRELELRYGKGVRRDVVRSLIQKTLSDALREDSLKSVLYVSPPEVLDDHGTGGFSFRFKAEVKPDVHPTGYLGMRIGAPEQVVTEEQIDNEIERLRQRHAIVEPVEDRDVVDANDFLLVKHQRLDQPKATEGQSHVDLNDEGLRPEMREALIGARVGESKDVVLALDDAEGAAVPAQLRVRVEAIKRRVLPEVDEELAENAAGVGTVAELRDKLKEQLAKQADQERKRTLRRKLEDALVESAAIELPTAFVESRLDDEVESQLRMLQGGRSEGPVPIPRSELRERLREQVERRVRLEFLLSAIADRESIQVTDGEVERAVSDVVRSSGQLGPALQKAYAERSARAGLRERLRLDKTLDFLLTKATISSDEPSGATGPDADKTAAGDAGSGEREAE